MGISGSLPWDRFQQVHRKKKSYVSKTNPDPAEQFEANSPCRLSVCATCHQRTVVFCCLFCTCHVFAIKKGPVVVEGRGLKIPKENKPIKQPVFPLYQPKYRFIYIYTYTDYFINFISL